MEKPVINITFRQPDFGQDFYLEKYVDGELQDIIDLPEANTLSKAWAEYQFLIMEDLYTTEPLVIQDFSYQSWHWLIWFDNDNYELNFGWKPPITEPCRKPWKHSVKLREIDNDLDIVFVLEYNPVLPYEQAIDEHAYFYKHVNRICQELNELATPLFD